MTTETVTKGDVTAQPTDKPKPVMIVRETAMSAALRAAGIRRRPNTYNLPAWSVRR